MRKITILLLLIFSAIGVQAQESDEPGETDFKAFVVTDTANVRAAPTIESDAIASVFDDDQLEVVGRNLDGAWFEVRRPGRMNKLGWISASLLRWEFNKEDLPLTDLTTGLEGDMPLTADPGYAVFVLENANMRAQPLLEAERLIVVPFATAVPVVARNQDGSWLLVNYLGTQGWIISFNTRRRDDLLEIPEAPNLPPLSVAPVTIIPPEVQLAEVEGVRLYVLDHRGMANELEYFWNDVLEGEVMPCEPPPFVLEFLYTREDERAFPELPRFIPRLNEGVGFINTSIDAMYTCGVVNPDIVLAARNDAINARVIFNATLDILDNIESIIRSRRVIES